MKRGWKYFLIVSAVLIIPVLVFSTIRTVECSPDESVYPVSLPLAKAVVKHIEKSGVPENLAQIENSPYTLIPCSQKTGDFECEQYYFLYKSKPFSAALLKMTDRDNDVWVKLLVEHDFTVNFYHLSENNTIETDALHPNIARRTKGICHQFNQ